MTVVVVGDEITTVGSPRCERNSELVVLGGAFN